MDPWLSALAKNALDRLEGRPFPSGPPQLLACAGDLCVLRGPAGPRVAAAEHLPDRLDLAPLLDADLAAGDPGPLCEAARARGFAAVRTGPDRIADLARRLAGGPALPCVVLNVQAGLGEAIRRAVEAGAVELDLVLPASGVVQADRCCAEARAAAGVVPLKLLLPAGLEAADLARLARTAVAEGLAFVGGAEAGPLRRAVGHRAGVKAEGRVRTPAEALAQVRAGATRLGLPGGAALALTALNLPELRD